MKIKIEILDSDDNVIRYAIIIEIATQFQCNVRLKNGLQLNVGNKIRITFNNNYHLCIGCFGRYDKRKTIVTTYPHDKITEEIKIKGDIKGYLTIEDSKIVYFDLRCNPKN